MLKVIPTDLPEVLILEYQTNFETRGCSYTNFSKQELEKVGINIDFVEENVYCPKRAGTLYGREFILLLSRRILVS